VELLPQALKRGFRFSGLNGTTKVMPFPNLPQIEFFGDL
jgi:hypothetical protein